ncbi:hypothetical protein [Actinorhabdospora filicis]|nr:hypothetical protein [Actinorhabdospora filicis]
MKTFVTELGATATVSAEGGHFPIWDDQAAPPLPIDLPEVARLVANCF